MGSGLMTQPGADVCFAAAEISQPENDPTYYFSYQNPIQSRVIFGSGSKFTPLYSGISRGDDRVVSLPLSINTNHVVKELWSAPYSDSTDRKVP